MFISEIIGNLGADAQIKTFGEGSNARNFVSFSVAHDYQVRNQDGTKSKATQWIDVLWYGNGGNVFQYLKKGTSVFVRGSNVTKTFQRRDGSVDVAITINATEVQLCGSRQDNNANQGQSQAGGYNNNDPFGGSPTDPCPFG